jgi:hypothetical protein
MKITYLLGAGASANALPVVGGIKQRVEEMIKTLSLSHYELNGNFQTEYILESHSRSKLDVQRLFVEDLKWLSRELDNRASIDTYAKKLYLTKDDKTLNKLKLTFSLFLVLEQIIRSPDLRYDSFFASILNFNTIDFPENIRILTWNYDSQFEIAFSEYSGDATIQANQFRLNLLTPETAELLKAPGFKIVKLNGTTDYKEARKSSVIQFSKNVQRKLTPEVLSEILEHYIKIRVSPQAYEMNLKFAWEQSLHHSMPSKDIAIEVSNNSDILIVIGYSFPYFNRYIDREIVAAMNPKKVYFQSLEPELIKERFRAFDTSGTDRAFIEKKNINQFLLPDEL